MSRSTHGHDGWVAVDMTSRTTRDATLAVVEAVELARWVDRPNLLVVIAATDEGLTAIRECVGLGLGVVVAGVFSTRRYRQVVDAYLDGLELRLALGLPLSRLAALAAVPVGLLDGAVDRQLAGLLGSGAPQDGPGASAVPDLRGRTAQAVARQMYRAHEESVSGERWRELRAGARPLRLLWTGSNVVGPSLACTRYVESLVCWGTAQAMSPAVLAQTARAMRLRGDTLTGTAEDAERHMAALADLGIAYDAMVPRLEDRWATCRVDAWQRLLRVVEERLRPTGAASGPAHR